MHGPQLPHLEATPAAPDPRLAEERGARAVECDAQRAPGEQGGSNEPCQQGEADVDESLERLVERGRLLATEPHQGHVVHQVEMTSRRQHLEEVGDDTEGDVQVLAGQHQREHARVTQRGRCHEDLAHLEAAYDGEILYWDRHFGQLMNELRQRGLEQNTVVIVTSDHGEEFTEHGMFKHGYQLFDESVRVPLVIRAPGLVASDRRRVPVETRGIMRAAMQLMELSSSSPKPDDLLQIADGDPWPTFSHTLRKREPDGPREFPVVAVRDSEWKLIHWPQSGRSELFNLLDDPRESRNVLASRSEVGEKYLEFLRRWFEPAQSTEEAKAPRPLNPETIEKLRSLGYVQ